LRRNRQEDVVRPGYVFMLDAAQRRRHQCNSEGDGAERRRRSAQGMRMYRLLR
jgi:hypothetical protein